VTHSGSSIFVQTPRGTAGFGITPLFVVPGHDVALGGLNAPMPGVILDVRVEVGQHVTKGETVVVMEAMKMEHVISAPSSGTVSEIFVATAQQVDNGAVLLTIDDDADAKDAD
jgi:propionyl-CoA carboxylase alpha chain